MGTPVPLAKSGRGRASLLHTVFVVTTLLLLFSATTGFEDRCPNNCNGRGSCASNVLRTVAGGALARQTDVERGFSISGEDVGQVVQGVKSKFDKKTKDRRWSFAGVPTETGSKPWTLCNWASAKAPSAFKLPLASESGAARVLVGFGSRWVKTSGRSWRFRFCDLRKGYELTKCSTSRYYANTPRGDFDFRCEHDQVVTSVQASEATDLDRKWKYTCCTIAEASCKCGPGWTGEACQKPFCSGQPMECTNPQQGTCVLSGKIGGQCKCNKGFWGMSCERKECPGKLNVGEYCTRNGKCDGATGTCECAVGWSGRGCEWPRISFKLASVIKVAKAKVISRGDWCQQLGSFDGQSESKPKAARWDNGHCYVHFPRKRTFVEARRHCETIGGHVVTITTDSEAEFVGRIFEKNFEKGGVWLGLTNDLNPETFGWITGEIPVQGEGEVFGKWKSKHPENGSFSCVIMDESGDNTWSTSSCSTAHDFVCEFSNIPKIYKPYYNSPPDFAQSFRMHSNEISAKIQGLVEKSRDETSVLTSMVEESDDNISQAKDAALKTEFKQAKSLLLTKQAIEDNKIETGDWKHLHATLNDDVNAAESHLIDSRDRINDMSRAHEALTKMKDGLVVRSTALDEEIKGGKAAFATITTLLGKLAKAREAEDGSRSEAETENTNLLDKAKIFSQVYMNELETESEKMLSRIEDSRVSVQAVNNKLKSDITTNSAKLTDGKNLLSNALKTLHTRIKNNVALTRETMGLQCNCIRGKTVDFLQSTDEDGWTWTNMSTGSWKRRIGLAGVAPNQGLMCQCMGDIESQVKFGPDGYDTLQFEVVLSGERTR